MNAVGFFTVIGVALLIASLIFGLRYVGWEYQRYHEVDRVVGWILFATGMLILAFVAGAL